jgi:hypothetical protein
VRGRVRVGVIGNPALLYLYSERTEVNSCWNGSSLLPIQYRGEYGRFLMSASCVTISNSDLLSSSETRANPGIRSWKEHSSAWAWCQKVIGGMVVSISRIEVKKWDSKPWTIKRKIVGFPYTFTLMVLP